MKFRPGYLALAPLAPLGAAVAHAALTPRKTSAYQPQPDPERAMAYAEKLSAMIRCDTTSYANVREPEKFERFHALLRSSFRSCTKSSRARTLTAICSITGRARRTTVRSCS